MKIKSNVLAELLSENLLSIIIPEVEHSLYFGARKIYSVIPISSFRFLITELLVFVDNSFVLICSRVICCKISVTFTYVGCITSGESG